jgi:hypothetical protein
MAWIGAALVVLCAAGLVVFVIQRTGTAPVALLVWTIGATSATLLPAVLGFVSPVARHALLGGAGLMLAWQCLLVAYTHSPSARSARAIAAAAQPWIRADTPVYSVGEFRHSLPFYLDRTVTIVAYTGEFEFGMSQEPGRNAASQAEFVRHWSERRGAVAFVEPRLLESLRRDGLTGPVVASDSRSVVVVHP